MPGPSPKPPERRQRTNGKAAAVITFPKKPAGVVSIPAPPRDFLSATKELWRSFWKSELARIVVPETDMAAIVRYYTLLDERERAYRAYRRERLVTGSQGQSVLNPMGRMMGDLDAEIRQLEDRLGLTPRARLQLGISFSEAAKSLAELNRLLEEDSDEQSEEGDPREDS